MKRWLDWLCWPMMPAIRTGRSYSLFKLRKDLLAGMTVSFVELPQAMAYAMIAGVSPIYGIYTSVLQGILGALLSSSEHLTTGPTNTQSLLIASAATRAISLAGPLPADQQARLYLELVFTLTILKGMIQLLGAALQLGRLVRFVSRSVIVGISAGAGVLIFVGQLPAFLGITLPARPADALPGVLTPCRQLLEHLHQINPHAFLLGLGCLTIMLLIRQISPFLPGQLLAIVLSAVTVGLMGWQHHTVATVQSIVTRFPSLHVPAVSWPQIESLLGGALALALLGILESIAIVKSIAGHTDERIDPNREFFGQGFKNLVTGFFQCIPGSGSFTRSALDHAAGAQTRFASVFNAIFVGLFFVFGSHLIDRVPLTALAAVLLTIAAGLIDLTALGRIWRASRADGAVCLTTFAATLLLPLEYAIFTGIFLSLGLYIRKSSRLHLSQMEWRPGGLVMERPVHDRGDGGGPVVFLQLEGELFFGVADELADRLQTIAASPVRAIVIRLKRTHSLDVTVLRVLEQVTHRMKQRPGGGYLLLCGVRPELMRILERDGLLDRLGRENVFPTSEGIFTSAKLALQRARRLAGLSIDLTPRDRSIDITSWGYEI